MSSGDKSKTNDSAHVSLFPSPPWQLVNKHQSPSSESPIRPPTPPGTSVYRMFGNLYNLDDAILRSLESQGVRRVYPQTYNRKRELRKLNFSILANYLDLLDIITRDPSSTKRTERLDNLAVLFINMHHLVNEYRQHQARDLLREILKYQVAIASQTVEKAEQYMARADEVLRNAGCELVLSNQASAGSQTSAPTTSATNYIDTVRNGLSDLGPNLAPLLQTVLDETMGLDPTGRREPVSSSQRGGISLLEQRSLTSSKPNSCEDDELAEHLDPILWRFLNAAKISDTSQEEFGLDNQ